jgi:cyclopropane-fatty-acyl-phospholipid synthase
MKRFGLDSLFGGVSALSHAVARRVVLEAAAHISEGYLEAELPGGERRSFGKPGRRPTASVRVFDDAAFARVLAGGEVAAGETYVDGLWDSPDLTALLTLALLNQEHMPPLVRRLGELPQQAGRVLGVASDAPTASGRGNAAVPEPGSDFFALFLDETMAFSCPVYESPGQPLVEAQANKNRVILDMAGIGPSDVVVDLGCGWGSFTLQAAAERGCRVTAVTHSHDQASFVARRAAAAGLQDRVAVQVRDFRDVDDVFDKLVSVETLHAVGATHFEEYFRKCDSLLRPGGTMVLQTIAVEDALFERQKEHVNWVQKYIYPGGALPSLAAVERAVRPTGLAVRGARDVGANYAPAIRAWRQRFESNLAAVRNLGLDERVVRTWRYYLCASEAALAAGLTTVFQVLLDKR